MTADTSLGVNENITNQTNIVTRTQNRRLRLRYAQFIRKCDDQYIKEAADISRDLFRKYIIECSDEPALSSAQRATWTRVAKVLCVDDVWLIDGGSSSHSVPIDDKTLALLAPTFLDHNLHLSHWKTDLVSTWQRMISANKFTNHERLLKIACGNNGLEARSLNGFHRSIVFDVNMEFFTLGQCISLAKIWGIQAPDHLPYILAQDRVAQTGQAHLSSSERYCYEVIRDEWTRISSTSGNPSGIAAAQAHDPDDDNSHDRIDDDDTDDPVTALRRNPINTQTNPLLAWLQFHEHSMRINPADFKPGTIPPISGDTHPFSLDPKHRYARLNKGFVFMPLPLPWHSVVNAGLDKMGKYSGDEYRNQADMVMSEYIRQKSANIDNSTLPSLLEGARQAYAFIYPEDKPLLLADCVEMFRKWRLKYKQHLGSNSLELQNPTIKKNIHLWPSPGQIIQRSDFNKHFSNILPGEMNECPGQILDSLVGLAAANYVNDDKKYIHLFSASEMIAFNRHLFR